MSTVKQRQDIGYLRKILSLDDELYYEMLNIRYGVSSSKELTETQVKDFLTSLRNKGREMGVFHSAKRYGFQKYKHNNLENRDSEMASPKQLRMIEAKWFKISRAQNDTDREKALNSFIQRITGVSNIRFLKKQDVNKIIAALIKMGG